MVKGSGLNSRRTVARATAAALTAALVATGTSAAFAADAPGNRSVSKSVVAKPSGAAKSGIRAKLGNTQLNGLYGVDGNGTSWEYLPNFKGGLGARDKAGTGWQYTSFVTQADQDSNGGADGVWDVTDGQLTWTTFNSDTNKLIGGGWNIYNRVLSAGNLGGAAADDLLARDGSGVLWLYLGYGTDGKVTPRYKVGAGWNAYTEITGKGDLTGDGKDDVVARDSSGVLWLYQGTGNYKAPFASRVKIGSGWNTYNKLISVGDIDADHVTDLVARDKDGALWLYRGTGKAATPYQPRVKIGTSGWNTYRILF